MLGIPLACGESRPELGPVVLVLAIGCHESRTGTVRVDSSMRSVLHHLRKGHRRLQSFGAKGKSGHVTLSYKHLHHTNSPPTHTSPILAAHSPSDVSVTSCAECVPHSFASVSYSLTQPIYYLPAPRHHPRPLSHLQPLWTPI